MGLSPNIHPLLNGSLSWKDHLKQGSKRAMSKPESNYMWGNVDNTIKIIESPIDLIKRKTDLYEPIFFLKTMMVVHTNHLTLLENLC